MKDRFNSPKFKLFIQFIPAQLQGKLAELGTNLVLIKDQYEKMSAFKTEIAELDKRVTEMQTTVAKAEIITQDAESFKKQIDTLKIEVENLWQGLNFLSNPYK